MSTSVSVPGRIELLGNHTDYNGGRILVASTHRVVTVRIDRTKDGRVTVTSDALRGRVSRSIRNLKPIVGPGTWANHVLGAVEILGRENDGLGGWNIHVGGDLPLGAGLASSAAVGVATLRAILKLTSRRMPLRSLATCAQAIENDFVGVPTGPLDPLSCALGRRGRLMRLNFAGEPRVETIPLPSEWKILVFDSGQRHTLAASKYGQRRRECAAAAQSLGVTHLGEIGPETFAHRDSVLSEKLRRRARHVVTESARVDQAWKILARCGSAGGIGSLLNASHRSSQLDFDNSHPAVDRLVARLQSIPEVAGARLTGGGFGGAVIGWVRRADVKQVLATLAADAAAAPRLLDLV